MTVISDQIHGIAGIDDNTIFTFAAANLRQNNASDGIITTVPIPYTATDGVLTTDDLDPGTASVTVLNTIYPITIPDSSTPVRLWPLIAAG